MIGDDFESFSLRLLDKFKSIKIEIEENNL